MIVSTVVRSLNTGMTTESSGSGGTARSERAGDIEIKNVPHLLIFAPNWLGDAVMALPAMADLRRAMPDARIDVAARPHIAPLFALTTGVDEVVVIGGAGNASDLVRGRHANAVLLLTNSFQTALTVWRAGVPERWGYRTDWRGPLLTRSIRPPFDAVHQATYYQQLVRALGCENGPLEPRLEATAEGKQSGLELLVDGGWDERAPLVALAPGAAYGGAKRWPAERFAALAASLARDGVRSVLVGGPADAAAGAEVGRILGTRLDIMNLIGRTDLATLAGVLVRCRTLVSNDSGAMHFAAALGVPVTAIFGPTDERATSPLGRSGRPAPAVLTHQVWCRPCMLRECPLTHRCMKLITAEEARKNVRM
jgi:lipopolysaccharide heptosyltransferase II